MELTEHMTILGGACTRAVIVERCGRPEVDRALRAGLIVRVGRGRYALAGADKAVVAAARWGGVLSMRSAAQRHGWGQKLVPDKPDVTFPRTHHLPREARAHLVPHWSNVEDDDVVEGMTSKRRTLVDCMRNLPLDESVPIVDSAVRCGDVTRRELMEIAFAMRGRGRARARAVAALASQRPANAYESTLRAIALQVPGLRVEPQVRVNVGDLILHPDLYDEQLGIVIEAESFEWHGKRAALERDCRRYNAFVLAGKLVVRFSWEQVMFEATYVVSVLTEVVTLARRVRQHANVARGPTGAVA